VYEPGVYEPGVYAPYASMDYELTTKMRNV